jgi:hypothetical protein
VGDVNTIYTIVFYIIFLGVAGGVSGQGEYIKKYKVFCPRDFGNPGAEQTFEGLA